MDEHTEVDTTTEVECPEESQKERIRNNTKYFFGVLFPIYNRDYVKAGDSFSKAATSVLNGSFELALQLEDLVSGINEKQEQP